jgi:hypothetical protein
VAAAADSVVCDGQVKDQAPAASCIMQVVQDLDVASPLACAGRDDVLGAYNVANLSEERA